MDTCDRSREWTSKHAARVVPFHPIAIISTALSFSTFQGVASTSIVFNCRTPFRSMFRFFQGQELGTPVRASMLSDEALRKASRQQCCRSRAEGKKPMF